MMDPTPAQRLIVAADYPPNPLDERYAFAKVRTLVRSLRGSGVCIKVNSSLRWYGADLIRLIQSHGITCFTDLKLTDIPDTLSLDGKFLRMAKPKFVTVMCNTGVDSLIRLKDELPDTLVLGVTVLTSMTEKMCNRVYGTSINDAVRRLADIAEEAGIDGLVASAKEVPILRNRTMLLVTPGIRFAEGEVANDDQNQSRVFTPAAARQLGADYLVIGRPITQAPDPLEAVARAVQELETA